MYEALNYHVEGQIAVLCINRPRARNAINFQAMREMEEVLQRIESSGQVGALILTATGEKVFCAGGDIKEFRELKSEDDARRMSTRMQSILSRLETLNIPVIVAINGDAYGGGCEIIVAGDIRIASQNARLAFRQIQFGIMTGWGGAQRLIRIVGRSRAIQLLLTGQTITAEEGLQCGLIDEVVPSGEVMLRARALAEQITSNSLSCIHSYMASIRQGMDIPLDEAISFETDLFCKLWVSEAREQQFEAFTRKKPGRRKK
ncbi:MAG: hypothetical protein GTO14_23290 [Anaerolineales bacterium]|nr:hypothetical protein [Anaerolineales bacterium]